MVTLQYNGRAKGVNKIQAKGIRCKGVFLPHGKPVKGIDPRIAGALLNTAPEGAITVLDGTPDTSKPIPATAKAVMAKEAGFKRLFPVDPARALDSVESIPAKVLKLGGDLKAVKAGKVDSHLAPLALLAKLTGELDVAEACAQRADVVAGRVAPAADPVVEVPAPEGAPAKPAA